MLDKETLQPPEYLAEPGRRFWQAVTADFDVGDADSLALLEHAAVCLDRAAHARWLIDRDGLVLADGKANPAAALELQYQRTFRMTCRELGLTVDSEPYTRPPRPTGNRAAGRTD